MNPEFRDLLNGEINGSNSPEDSHRLRAHFASHPEDEVEFEELCKADAIIASLEMVDPPPELRQNLLGVVRQSGRGAPETAMAGGGPVRRLLEYLGAGTGRGYAFATGLALGTLLMLCIGPWLTSLDTPSQAELYGASLSAVMSGQSADRVMTIDHPDADGDVQVWFGGDRTVVRIEYDGDGPLEVALDSEERMMCRTFRAIDPGRHDLVTDTGSTRLTMEGPGIYEFTLEGGGDELASLSVRISKDGIRLDEKVMTRN